MSILTPTRVIRAMRDCLTDYGQGYSPDREAMKYAQVEKLLVFVEWPAGFWKITDLGIEYISSHESTKKE